MVLVDETNAGDTPGRECACEVQEKRPLAGMMKPSSGTMSDDTLGRRAGGGGGAAPFVIAGRLLSG